MDLHMRRKKNTWTGTPTPNLSFGTLISILHVMSVGDLCKITVENKALRGIKYIYIYVCV